MSVIIDDDIPFPDDGQVWPFGTLTCGQSFSVPSADAAGLRKAAAAWKARHTGWDYITKAQGDGTVRLWCKAVPVAEPTSNTYAANLADAIDDSVPETWAELQERLKRERDETMRKLLSDKNDDD